MSDGTPVARVAALAQRQGGHVTTAQLIELGVSRGRIAVQVRAGWLIRVHRGVYAVGHRATLERDRAWAALLATGPRSALAGWSAAALWELVPRYPRVVAIISPQRRRVPGTDLRRCGTLLHRDITTHQGVRVTSPARTLLDLAPRVSSQKLDRFHNELRMRRLITTARLTDVVSRNCQHPGAALLRELAGMSAGEAKRSPLEVAWPRFATHHALPPYVMNVPVAGYTVDVLFPPERLVVELDGWGTHGTRSAYEHDRSRDADILARTGIPTLRITHRALSRDALRQAERVREILARRGAQ